MDIKVSFAGGKKINAEVNGKTIYTDQPRDEGGENTAPAPFEYLLASLATCAGYYVMSYLQARDLPIEGVQVIQRHSWNEKSHRLENIELIIQVPADIPERHHRPLERAAASCSVKKLIQKPPPFEIRTEWVS